MAFALRALRSHLKDATPLEPSGGFHLSVLFPKCSDDVELCRRAAEQGFAVEPLSSFYQYSAQLRGLVLGLGAMSERIIDTAIRRLSESITADTA
ncbi:MAG TPA: hypothetical protein VHY79_01995 [Rhizomicrobium sp.]|jgi:DNA-binding transcriptional MocR family regulator|nr:hypothetical protein [Rhizomicrobium sp.]